MLRELIEFLVSKGVTGCASVKCSVKWQNRCLMSTMEPIYWASTYTYTVSLYMVYGIKHEYVEFDMEEYKGKFI